MTNTKAISPLRQRMIEDRVARKLGRESQRGHIASCKRFAAYLKRSPETATADDGTPSTDRLLPSPQPTSNDCARPQSP